MTRKTTEKTSFDADVLIIGGGIGGLAAAITIKEPSPDTDVLLVDKLAYAVRIPFTHRRLFDTAAPRRGDLVVFEDPRQPGRVEVKRVVGVAGDVVELWEQILKVNGVPQPRSAVGEYALAEPTRADEAGSASICRRYLESLAKGVLEPAEADQPAADGAGRWEQAALAGVAAYDVLQCRQPRPA